MGKDAYDVMDLKALRCFWAAATGGSLTRAGIELGITEAAVSQRIKALEAYLGVKLYESRGGRFRLMWIASTRHVPLGAGTVIGILCHSKMNT